MTTFYDPSTSTSLSDTPVTFKSANARIDELLFENAELRGKLLSYEDPERYEMYTRVLEGKISREECQQWSNAKSQDHFYALIAEQTNRVLLEAEVDELVALMYDLMRVVEADPELAQYPAAKAARELLAEKYSGDR